MTEVEYSQASEASELCQACGLCCTGHLFSWVRLKAVELTPLEKLGLPVIRNDPRQRGFLQPCPMWNGTCKIYESPHYPSGCRSYNCKLLRELLDESAELEEALRVVKQAKAKMRGVEKILPPSTQGGFRERFVEHIEQQNASGTQAKETTVFQAKAAALLEYLDENFGVNDFLEKPQVTGYP